MRDFDAKVNEAFNSCAIGDYFATRHDVWENRTTYLWKVTEDTCWWAYSKETMLSEITECDGLGWWFHASALPLDVKLFFLIL